MTLVLPTPLVKPFDPYVRIAQLVPTENNKGRHAAYDGDSVKMYIDNGFFQERLRIATRFNRIDTPELRGGTDATKLLAREARDFVRETLEFEMVNYGGFLIHSVGMETGKFGRWIVEIYLHDGTNLNDLLVDKGLAIYKQY